MISTSDGPAKESIPTSPKTCLLASETKTLPGPKILSDFVIVSVPYAIAAIA